MVKILLVSFGGMIDGADFRRPAEGLVMLAFGDAGNDCSPA
jgi:hypothetical protein